MSWNKWINDLLLDDVYYFDPPGDGNCQISAISKGLFPIFDHTPDELRQMAAKEVFSCDATFIANAVLDDRAGYERKRTEYQTREALSALILSPVYTKNYWDYQGDDVTLALIHKALKEKVDFVILTEKLVYSVVYNEDSKEPKRLVPEAVKVNGHTLGEGKAEFTIFLLRKDLGDDGKKVRVPHYQTLGYVNNETGMPQGLFFTGKFPESFQLLSKKSSSVYKRFKNVELYTVGQHMFDKKKQEEEERKRMRLSSMNVR